MLGSKSRNDQNYGSVPNLNRYSELEDSHTKFNNQTVILMSTIKKNIIMLMHDTRIFYFKLIATDLPKRKSIANNSAGSSSAETNNNEVNALPTLVDPRTEQTDPENTGATVTAPIGTDGSNDNLIHGAGNELGDAYDSECEFDIEETYEELTQIFLRLLTTKKYRIINAIYFLFRIIDNTMLVALIISLLMGLTIDEFEKEYAKKLEIFVVLAVEAFYDIMEYSVKIWIINRVSIYVGCTLFVTYYIVFDKTHLFEEFMIYVLYMIRLGAFIIEESVDFAMDLEIASDLRKECVNPICGSSGGWPWSRFKLQPIRININKHKFEYVGSICVWTWYNVFEYVSDIENEMNREPIIDNNGNTDKFDENGDDGDIVIQDPCCCQWLCCGSIRRTFLVSMIALTALSGILLFLPVTIFVLLLSVMLKCYNCCRNRQRGTILSELMHEHSV